MSWGLMYSIMPGLHSTATPAPKGPPAAPSGPRGELPSLLMGPWVSQLPGRAVGKACHLEPLWWEERALRVAESPVREPAVEMKDGLSCREEQGVAGSFKSLGTVPLPHPASLPRLCSAGRSRSCSTWLWHLPLCSLLPSRSRPLEKQEGSRDSLSAVCRVLVPGSVAPKLREI